MALRGDLASVDLAQVFQMLALNQKVGLLSIQSRHLWKVLAFDHRGVTVHHNVHVVLDRVVASFVRSGRLDADALEEVQDHAARVGQALTDSLLAGGYLEAAELEQQYRIELEEEVYELFFCRDARFEFYEGQDQIDGYEGHTDERFFLHCDSVVMEAARRIDEWAYIIERVPSTDEFFVAIVDSISIDEFGAESAALFELLDGRRSVQRIIDLTGLPNFTACKTVGQLLDANAIGPVAEEDLVDLAAECEAEDRLLDAVNLYERATSAGIAGSEVHSLAANAYRNVDRYEDASRHLQAEAELLVEAGDCANAVIRLIEVKHMLPSALGTRERLVELALEEEVEVAGFDAMAEGKELVELLLEFGDVERVRRLLEQLLRVAPEDLDLKKALVSVHVKAGDQQRVAELYESIADDLVDLGLPLEAVGYLQKILLMDRTRSDISERVRRLYEHDERSRRRTRSLGVLATMFCLLIAVGVFYWFYNQRAGQEFDNINVTEMLAHDDFAGASMAHTDFIRTYPFTTSVAKAEAELKQIEASRRRFEARRQNERAVRDGELQRKRDDYQQAWAKQRELFLGGKPEEALVALGRVRELIAATGAPQDVEWAIEQQVERTWKRLTEYIAGAGALATEYDKVLAAGNWQRAREIALQLRTDYDNTVAAARVGIPVMVHTRPTGARLMHDGKPLEHIVDGVAQPLVTPALVLCGAGDGQLALVTELDGFAPRELSITPAEQAVVRTVLEVMPTHRIQFPAKLQTGIAAAGGWIATGLRGGRLGVSRTDGTQQRVIELAGLKEASTTPVVRGGRAFFVSNENTVESIDLETGAVPEGWPVPLANGASTALVADRGRVVVVDGEHVVHCWEQGSGAHLWSLALNTLASGPPTIHRRQVIVGTIDGRVILVDAADGNTLGVLRSQDAISTRICTDGEVIAFGCSNGIVRTVDIATGRVLWEQRAGKTVSDGMIALGGETVCAVADDKLMFWRRETGDEIGVLSLDGAVQPGLQLHGRRVFVRVQRPQIRNLPPRDVLLAFDASDAVVLWEFAASVKSDRSFGADDLAAAFAAADDTIVVFR